MEQTLVQEARQELKEWLVKHTAGCDVQANGWPCGTCTTHLLGALGLTPNHSQYDEHNDPIDRVNEVWRAILQIREAR